MDTVGVLAAWVSVISFLFAVLVAIASHLFNSQYQRWWARTSKKRAERRLKRLLSDSAFDPRSPSSDYIADLVSLYGSMLLNLITAVGLVMISIEILDLGPALLSATLPFNIDSKALTRATGVLMLLFSYFFIFRLAYLGIQIRRQTNLMKSRNAERTSLEISQLRARLGLID
jgi:hypothetical protein